VEKNILELYENRDKKKIKDPEEKGVAKRSR
jgi:hypothetical protein